MIEWNDSLIINHDEIDEQHKELIRMLNEIDAAIDSEDFNYTNIVNLVAGLERYVKTHFDYEERLMFEYSYPYIAEHTKEHNVFRDKLQNTYVLEIDSPKEFYHEMSEYLMQWLTQHILKVDKQFSRYLSDNKK